MTSLNCLQFYRKTPEGQRVEIFSLKNDRVTAVALFIVGAFMLGAGAFLFGAIGTIPASIGGFFLILAGLTSLVYFVLKTFNKN